MQHYVMCRKVKQPEYIETKVVNHAQKIDWIKQENLVFIYIAQKNCVHRRLLLVQTLEGQQAIKKPN